MKGCKIKYNEDYTKADAATGGCDTWIIYDEDRFERFERFLQIVED